MTDFQKDIFVSLLFISGLVGFISGAFIVSATIFAGSAILSNVNFQSRLHS